MYEKQTCSSSKSACRALSAGRQAAKAPPAERENWKEKHVRLLHGLKCATGCGNASGKARRRGKRSRFCLCGIFRVRPSAGVSQFHKRLGLFFYKVEYKNIQATEECGCWSVLGAPAGTILVFISTRREHHLNFKDDLQTLGLEWAISPSWYNLYKCSIPRRYRDKVTSAQTTFQNHKDVLNLLATDSDQRASC